MGRAGFAAREVSERETMGATTTVHLLRHGEVDNPTGVLYPGLEVRIDSDVIEAANVFEGQVFGKGNKALRSLRNWRYLSNPLTPSWGEPYVEIAERMTRAIMRAAEEVPAGGQALIVSHQLPIWIARCAAEGRRLPHDPRFRKCTLASVTSFGVLHGRIVRVDYCEPARDLIPAKDRRANISAGGAPE